MTTTLRPMQAPVNLGYQYETLAGGFEFDTSILGNHNTGHEFDDAPMGGGIIGRNLPQRSGGL